MAQVWWDKAAAKKTGTSCCPWNSNYTLTLSFWLDTDCEGVETDLCFLHGIADYGGKFSATAKGFLDAGVSMKWISMPMYMHVTAVRCPYPGFYHFAVQIDRLVKDFYLAPVWLSRFKLTFQLKIVSNQRLLISSFTILVPDLPSVSRQFKVHILCMHVAQLLNTPSCRWFQHGRSTGLHCYLNNLHDLGHAVHIVLTDVLKRDLAAGLLQRNVIVSGASMGGCTAVLYGMSLLHKLVNADNSWPCFLIGL